jgi:serine/threonine-protein kinase
VTNAGVGAYAAATIASPRIPVEPPPPYGRQPGRSGRPAIYTLLTLLALALLVGGILLAAVKLGNSQKTVVVPNVVHKTEQQATQALAAKGLVPVTKLVASSQKINTVISQSPKAGDDVKKKSRVVISVSSGVGEGLVPDVTNKTIGDATKLLERNHFVVKVDPAQSSSAVDPGHIISTNPPIGQTQKFGTTIHLIPSSGVTVPNLVNVAEQDAANLLKQSGLTVRTLRENSDSIPSGNVTRTNPPPGTSNLKGGTVIDMYVSTGAKTVAVPSVQGLSEPDATAKLKGKGFVSSVILEPTTLQGNDGKVLSQSPNAGDQATPGSTVVLNVGSYTAPTTTTTTKPTPKTTTTTTTGP